VFIENRNRNLWIWEKPIWVLVPCVQVSFYFVPRSSIIKVGMEDSFLRKNYEQFWVDRTSPVVLPDKSGLSVSVQPSIIVLSVIC
jgi:hypothetical protein